MGAPCPLSLCWGSGPGGWLFCWNLLTPPSLQPRRVVEMGAWSAHAEHFSRSPKPPDDLGELMTLTRAGEEAPSQARGSGGPLPAAMSPWSF